MQENLDASEVKQAAKQKQRDGLEDQFLAHWTMIAKPLGLLDPKRQYKFRTGRRWAFDLAWPSIKLAVEIDGGAFMGRSGHNTAKGQYLDHEKGNAAVEDGWRVLRFNTIAMKDTEAVVEFVIGVMTNAMDVAAAEG